MIRAALVRGYSTGQAGRQRLGQLWRGLRRHLWPGAPSCLTLLLAAVACVALPFLLTYVAGIHFWRQANTSCDSSKLGCELGVHVVGTVLVGVLAYYVIFLRREARAAGAWRYRARKQPASLFPWLPAAVPPPFAGTPTRWQRAKQRASRAAFRVITGERQQPFIAEEIVGRHRLAKGIAEDLDENAGPQVIVGTTGSGKSTVLVELAQRLGRRGQVPVPVSLRGQASLDFEELARQAYRRQSLGRYSDDTERQWDWLRRRHLITVLADNLEKSDVTTEERVNALELARQHGLRLVVTCRPDGIPSDIKTGRIDLEPLDEDDVTDHLASRLRKASRVLAPREIRIPPEDAGGLARRFVDEAAPHITPYYLTLAGPLADRNQLPETEGDLRHALFEQFFSKLRAGELKPDAGLSRETRERVLESLEVVAYHRLLGVRKLTKISTAIRRGSAGERRQLEPAAMVDGASRLGILVNRHDGVVHFAHQTTLAYLASRYIRRLDYEDARRTALFEQDALTPSATLALNLANAAEPNRRLARETCEALLSRVDRDRRSLARAAVKASSAGLEPALNGKRQRRRHEADASTALIDRLAAISAAAEIVARIQPTDECSAAAVARRLLKERKRSGEVPAEAKQALRAAAKLRTSASNRALWTYAIDERVDYAVRREAIKELAQAGNSAAIVETTALIETHAAPAITTVRTLHAVASDDRGEASAILKAIAWLLPSVRTVAPNSVRCRLDELEQELFSLSQEESMQRGLEGSLAQGVKLDAACRPTETVHPVAAKLAHDGTFWFSRLLAVQAVAIRCADGRSTDEHRDIVRSARHDPHPFVREAASLCERALRHRREHGRGSWQRYIWKDMTEVASRTPRGLSTAATRLIGDVIIALNLNEQDHTGQLRKAFGDSHELPSCLSTSVNRHEILGAGGGPPDNCPIAVNARKLTGDPLTGCYCPYVNEYEAHSAVRRELSRGFCRHQRLHARPVPWQPRIRTRTLKEFWSRMERLARF